MKKVHSLLLIATMLFVAGVTHAATAPHEKVSKTDAQWNSLVKPSIPVWTLNALPELAMVQADLYYEETIPYCDFVEESIEVVYTEIAIKPPISASICSGTPNRC